MRDPSRRRFLKSVASGAAALGFAGAFPLWRVKAGGNVVRLGTTDRVNSFDLHAVWTVFGENVVQGNIVESLVRYNPRTGRIDPHLATEWTVERGGSRYVFRIRRGVRFHDGEALTAQAVRFSWQRSARLKGPGAYLLTNYVDTDALEAPDDETLVVVLRVPFSAFLDYATSFLYGVISPRTPADRFVPTQLAGTGPYVLRDWREGSQVVLEPFERYWGEPPANGGVLIRQYAQSSNLKFALIQGEVDLAWRDLALSDIADLLQNPAFARSEGLGQIRYITINTTTPPTDRPEVRQAVAAAIDRSELIQRAYNGMLRPLYSLLPATIEGSVPSFRNRYKDGDVDRARSLLQAAGYSRANPASIELWYTPTHYGPEEATVALLLKNQMERTGLLKVQLRSQEWTPYVNAHVRGELPHLSLIGWATLFPTAAWFLGNLLSQQALLEQGPRFRHEESFALVERLVRAQTAAEKLETARRLQDLTAETVPYVPLVQALSLVVHRKEVQGVHVAPGTFFEFGSISNT